MQMRRASINVTGTPGSFWMTSSSAVCGPPSAALRSSSVTPPCLCLHRVPPPGPCVCLPLLPEERCRFQQNNCTLAVRGFFFQEITPYPGDAAARAGGAGSQLCGAGWRCLREAPAHGGFALCPRAGQGVCVLGSSSQLPQDDDRRRRSCKVSAWRMRLPSPAAAGHTVSQRHSQHAAATRDCSSCWSWVLAVRVMRLIRHHRSSAVLGGGSRKGSTQKKV